MLGPILRTHVLHLAEPFAPDLQDFAVKPERCLEQRQLGERTQVAVYELLSGRAVVESGNGIGGVDLGKRPESPRRDVHAPRSEHLLVPPGAHVRPRDAALEKLHLGSGLGRGQGGLEPDRTCAQDRDPRHLHRRSSLTRGLTGLAR